MPSTVSLTSFVLASLVVLLLPGPGVLYVVTRSISEGLRAGITSVFGLSLGTLLHVVAATAGLSAILLASATAFTLVKFVGALYLIYLGVQAFVGRRATTASGSATGSARQRRLLWDGIVVSIFNPKIAVFFVAYLPQFVTPENGHVTQQILILGLIYVALALLTDSGYALLASRVRGRLSAGALQSRSTRYVSGGIFLGLGAWAALDSARR